MNTKYCSKRHSNPDDAVFCSECGEKLSKHSINKSIKICPKCKHENPNDAVFCSECGSSLSDRPSPKPKIVLEVSSSAECRTISTNPRHTRYRKVGFCHVFDFEEKGIVEVLFERDGHVYKKVVDTGICNKLELQWGRIAAQCSSPCQIKLYGPNMNLPIIIENTSYKVFSVPYGKYVLEYSLDGKIEKKNLNLDSSSTLLDESTLRKSFPILIKSDVKIEKFLINNSDIQKWKTNHTVKISDNTIEIHLPKAEYDFSIVVSDSHGYGHITKHVSVEKALTLDIHWCKTTIETNADEITCRFNKSTIKSVYKNNIAAKLYLARNEVYDFMFNVQSQTFIEKIKTEKNVLILERKWKDVEFHFDRNHYKGVPCYYEIYSSTSESTFLPTEDGQIPPSDIICRKLPYGPTKIQFYIGSIYEYEIGKRDFSVTDDTPTINCNIPIERSYKAKWQWLRKTIFYAIWFSCFLPVICVSLIPFSPLFSHAQFYIGYYILSILAFGAYSISSLFTLYFYYRILFDGEKACRKAFGAAILVIILGFVFMTNQNKYSDNELLFFGPLVLYVFSSVISHYVYNAEIKGYKIWNTVL